MKDQARPTAAHPAQTPLWEFVSPKDYSVPTIHAQRSAAEAWRLFKQVFHRKDISEGSFKAEQDLLALPHVRLAHLVPPLPWGEAAAALDSQLQGWMADSLPEQSVKFFIGQPFSRYADIVSLLGKRHRAREIPPPTVEQIFSNTVSWFDGWPSPGTFWVLPNLEQFYLRHANGLELLRRLLCEAVNGQLGKGVIGCDSWAWAYVQRIFPMPHTEALTLQAFDADRLQCLLLEEMKFQSKTQLHCYNAKNGQDIAGASADGNQMQKEFAELAAHCRGNAAVAATYWRERLRYKKDEDSVQDEEEMIMRSSKKNSDEHIWLADMPSDPELPIGNKEEFLLLLHTILLHGGLQESLLCELLPFSAARCQGLLGQLLQSGITHYANGLWQVREMAYMAVRRLMIANDYLTDSF